MWRIQVWDKRTRKWHHLTKAKDAGGAQAAVKLLALKGRVGQALHPDGERMRCYPARGMRPLTFSHYRPLEKKDDEVQTDP